MCMNDGYETLRNILSYNNFTRATPFIRVECVTDEDDKLRVISYNNISDFKDKQVTVRKSTIKNIVTITINNKVYIAEV